MEFRRRQYDTKKKKSVRFGSSSGGSTAACWFHLQALVYARRFFSLPLFNDCGRFLCNFMYKMFRIWGAHTIDEAKIIPPCHVNEHIIFDLASRAVILYIYVWLWMDGKFFFIPLFMRIYLFRCFRSLFFCHFASKCCFFHTEEITHGNKVLERTSRSTLYLCKLCVIHRKLLSLFFVDILIHLYTHTRTQTHARTHTQMQNMLYVLQCQCWHFQCNIYWLMHSWFLHRRRACRSLELIKNSLRQQTNRFHAKQMKFHSVYKYEKRKKNMGKNRTASHGICKNICSTLVKTKERRRN